MTKMSAQSGCVNCKDGSDQFDMKHEAECSEGEDAQIRLAPHVQAYLAHNSPTTNCCGIAIPIAFERAAAGTCWNHRFDSEILEGQYRSSSFKQIRLRFRFALLYILIFSISWFVYFVALGSSGVIVKWPFLCSAFAGVVLITSAMLFATFMNIYKIYTFKLSLLMALALCLLSLSLVTFTTQLEVATYQAADISQSGHFIMCIEILLIIYTLTPLPLFACVIIGVFFSVVFEILNVFLHMSNQEWQYSGIVVRVLLQLCVHIIGIHIYLMTFVRMRGTFMKVGQSLLVRRQVEMEKQLKEKMIHSVMPPKLASWLMEEQVEKVDTESHLKSHDPLGHRNSNAATSDIKSLFRPFNMSCMDNVSILFADIVGFTKMSSNKGADELVNILNDLFEKFDELCQNHGCEKISTLGDCYYCVSGCPEPRPDHATCCVEMGLGMIEAIQEFDRERGEGVNMRVGVHTGTVLCGIVGTKRFKFDVWSNDVTFANKMESTGMPGRVHISEETSRFLGGSYVLEEGGDILGHKTYFIEGRQLSSPYDHEHCLTPANPVNLRLIISPAISPQSVLSMNHSPLPLNFPRDLQRDSPRKDARKFEASNFLSPGTFNVRTKASSLPSILDSDTELDEKTKGFPPRTEGSSKSPTSVGSHGKYTHKFKGWKVPKFLRKHSDTPLHMLKKQDFGDKNIKFLERGDSNIQSSNGYQQVPIVIESQDTKSGRPVQSVSKLHIPHTHEMASFEREIIDIRSYLSESRSSMSPFGRSSSYRSQYGRPNNIEIPPVCRARSSTLATQGELIRPKDRRLHLPLSPGSAHTPPRNHEDAISLCPSVNSRKDSGIRSTSRRSSIQHQIFALNQSTIATSQHDIMQHRVSGYYTSSQSSLNDPPSRSRLPPPLNDKQVQSLQKLRKQSDLQLIRCVQDSARTGTNYFVQPPLNRLTLFFKSAEMERHYRDKAHRSDDCEDFPPTLTTSRFNTALDTLVSTIIFLVISTSIFVLYRTWERWLCCFILFTVIEAISITLCIYRHYIKWKSKNGDYVSDALPRSVRIFRKLSNWHPWHLVGSLLISLPILSVLINFSCKDTTMTILKGEQSFYVYLLCVSIVQFCNFTQMNWLVKNILVSLYAGLFLFLAVLGCHEANTQLYNADIKFSPQVMARNFSDVVNTTFNSTEEWLIGNSSFVGKDSIHHKIHLTELYLDVVLLLMLVWFLNREFEISYRLSFYSNVVANRDKQRVQNMRNQADWLLHNIIPRHVADQLKNTAKYSENHKDVGIIFASIVNFNEMYDESYLRGKEYLRVLNELIADFDELLERPEFQHVEKIKTIGSTFMAASGLNPDLRHDSRGTHEHLYQLMDFALEMQKVLDNFNQDLLEFDFILRIGYNFGDVTAGVIGTTKLYYDIWGDAVNIASRMDSTGVAKRIQVGESCIPVLGSMYDFEPRGNVYVKGKDNMNVYLLVKKKEKE